MARPHPFVLPLLLQTLILLGAGGCSRTPTATAETERPASVPVTTDVAERRMHTLTQPVAGTIRPHDRAVLAARVMGTVQGADFVIGQSVQAGERLLRIEAAELAARVRQAQAALDQATRDASREQGLVERGASTEEAVRAAEDRLRMSQASFEEARTLEAYTEVKAPFAGTITDKRINTGDFAAPGTPLLELESSARMRAEIDVPASLPVLPVGAQVPVHARAGVFTGTITESSSAAQPATRTRRVIVELPGGTPVDSGEFVRVPWPAGETPQVTVPVAAILPFGQIERVFVVTDGTARIRFVKTGARAGGRVLILSGLADGERVILSPPPTLRDGHPVDVQP